MIERVVENEFLLGNSEDVMKNISDDEPCIIIKDGKPAYTILSYSMYEKMMTTIKVFNDDFLPFIKQ